MKPQVSLLQRGSSARFPALCAFRETSPTVFRANPLLSRSCDRILPVSAPSSCQSSAKRQSTVVRYTTSDSLQLESYLCLGLAHCFGKNEDGKLVDRFVIEPVGASSLECMAVGARTSYKYAVGITVGDAIQKDRSLLPAEFQNATFCEKFEYRCEAAARTWLRPHAQDNLMDIVPLGKLRGNFNFSLEDKRVLDVDIIVTDDDNIKQDLSIDVYGRKKKEEAAAALAAAETKAAAAKQEKQKQEDDLDALLGA